MLRITEYIKAQDKVISKYVKRALKLDSQEELARCFKELFIEATLLGVSSSETDIEHMSKRHFSERSSRRFRIELSDVKKTQSITDRASKFWDEYSFKLAGDFKESQLRATEKMFKKRIAEGGYTQKELKELISKELKIKNEVRLDMIVTTEMNKCFNYGRVENAREHKKNGGIVRALKFHAVMDLHTSYTCNVRNGLVLDLDDPRIDENTPPLHPRCRSMWIYVDKWDYEEEHNNQSSKEWDTHYLVQSKPDETWGNPFAYGGRKKALDGLKTKENSSIIKLGTLRKQLPLEYCDRIEDILEKSPELCQKVWNKYENKININGNYKGGAHFSPSKNIVNFNMKSDSKNILGNDTTIFHEIGHLFDCNSKEYLLEKNHNIFRASNLFDFNETLKKEAKEQVNKIWRELKKEDKSIKKIEAYSKLTKEIREIPLKARGDISDIFEGTIGINGGVGHGKSYWERVNVSTEAFAEMYSASVNNKESLEQIKKYFPESYDIFLKILEEMVK